MAGLTRYMQPKKKPRSSRMYLSNCSTDCREPNKTVCRADRTVVTERAKFRAVSVCGSLDLFSTARHQVNGRMLCVIQDYAQRGPSSPGPPTASTLYTYERIDEKPTFGCAQKSINKLMISSCICL